MSAIEIIAEIGVNHNGNLSDAQSLIYNAKSCGCDTVKFQLFHGDRYPQFQIDAVIMRMLKTVAGNSGIRFLCTPDDIIDARALRDMGCERIKVGSSNVTNEALLREIASYGLPVLLSTGACERDELMLAVRLLRDVPLTIMHCVSAYPAPVDQMNLSLIAKMRTNFARPIGLSDHTPDDSLAACVALGLGARVFEKHFTLNKQQPGPDHAMSLDVWQMQAYVHDLHAAASMLGDGIKTIMPCEVDNRRDYEQFVLNQVSHADSAAP